MSGLELLSDQGFRIDGRRPHELRKIEFRIGIFSHADGSAYIEQGNTKALATVYGPHEITSNKAKTNNDKMLVNCEYSMATFSTGERKKRPRGDRKSQEMSMHLCQTFEAAIIPHLHKNSQIDIFVQILEADGGNYSACVNAGTLALIDAGIPMYDYVCACTVGFVNETPLVDISHLEETLGNAELTIAVLPKTESVVLQEMTSRIHHDHFVKIFDAAVNSCAHIAKIMNDVIRKHASKKMQNLNRI